MIKSQIQLPSNETLFAVAFLSTIIIIVGFVIWYFISESNRVDDNRDAVLMNCTATEMVLLPDDDSDGPVRVYRCPEGLKFD